MSLKPYLLSLSASLIPLISSAALLTIPNASFEEGGAAEYASPPSWQEDQARDLGTPETDTNFANSGRVEAKNGLTPIDGTIMGRLAMNGDADSLTSFSGTMSNTLTDTFAANTEYTLTFYAARDSYVGSNQWYVLGGLRANGTDVASVDVDIRALTDGSTTGAEDTFYPVTVSFSTMDNPSVVGDPISIFVGFRHDNNYNKTIFFDDVSLDATAIPEPSTYAALAGLLALGFVAWRRRR